MAILIPEYTAENVEKDILYLQRKFFRQVAELGLYDRRTKSTAKHIKVLKEALLIDFGIGLNKRAIRVTIPEIWLKTAHKLPALI